MVAKYCEDRTLIDDHLAVLQRIAPISEYARTVHHIVADSPDIHTGDIKQLIGDIRAIIANASLLKSVYETLSAYCPEGYSALSADDIKNDLSAILLYQHTRDNLSSIEDEAREKLGEEYRGLSTDWDFAASSSASSASKLSTLTAVG